MKNGMDASKIVFLLQKSVSRVRKAMLLNSRQVLAMADITGLIPLLHKIVENCLEIIVGRGDLLQIDLMTEEQIRKPLIKFIGLRGLDCKGISLRLKTNAQDIRKPDQDLGQPPWFRTANEDVMRVLVYQVADLMHISLGQN